MRSKRVDDRLKTITMIDMATATETLLTVAEAAQLMRVSRQRVHKYLEDGVPFANGDVIEIPKVFRGGRYDLDRATVEKIASRRDRLRGRPKKSSDRY